MKKVRSIIVVLVLLVVLVGAYVYVSLNQKDENIEESTTSAATIELAAFDASSIVKIEMKSSERTLLLEKEEDIWIMNNNKDVEASQTLIGTVADTLSDIQATQLVEENAQDLSVYGLDNPYKTTITLSDGTTHTFLLGDEVPTGYSYYFALDGSNDVYIVKYSYKNSFKYTFEELVSKETFGNLDTSALNYMYINQEGRPVIELSKPGDTALDAYEMWHSLSLWKMTSPYEMPRGIATNDAWETLTSGLTVIASSVRNYITTNAPDLSVYGLDNPWLEVKFGDSNGGEIHLYFGGTCEADSGIYFMQEGSKSIYTMAPSAVEPFTDVNAFDIADKMAMIISVADITQVTVTKAGEAIVFDVVSEDVDGTINVACTVDGKSYPEADFKKLYQNLIGLSLDSEYKGEKVTGTPDITVKITMKDGRELESKYYLYEQNKNYYIFDKNGTQEFLIGKRNFDNLFERIDEFFNGTISN